MALGEFLSVGLELNVGSWETGARRAEAATARMQASVDVQAARMAESVGRMGDAYIVSARQAEIAAERIAQAQIRMATRANTAAFNDASLHQDPVGMQRATDEQVRLAQQMEDSRATVITRSREALNARLYAEGQDQVRREATLAAQGTLNQAREDEVNARLQDQQANAWNQRMVFMQRAANRLSQAVSQEMQYIRNAIASVLGVVDVGVKAFDTLAFTASSAFRILADSSSAFASLFLKTFANLPLLGIEKGIGIAEPLLQEFAKVPSILASGLTALAGTGGALMSAVNDVFGGIGKAAASAVGTAFQAGMNGVTAVIAGAFLALPFVEFITPIGVVLSGAVFGALAILETLTNGVSGIVGSIVQGFSQAVDAIRKGVEGIVNFTREMVGTIKDFAAAAFEITTQVAGFMSQTGADFVEEANKFNVAFRGFGSEVNNWLVQFGQEAGRSQLELVRFTSTLQSTLVTLGFTRAEASKFSMSISGLAVDLASFFNVADDKAFQALESGIMGNHRALRQFGIGINVTTLLMELHRDGTVKTIQEYTEYEKALARLNIILRQTTDMQGDAARTINSFANQIKVLSGIVTDLATRFGLELNKKISDLITSFNSFEDVKVILSAVFPIVVALTSKLAEMALSGVHAAANWLQSGEGFAVFVVQAQIFVEKLYLGFQKMELFLLALGVGFTGLVPIVKGTLEIIVAGFDWLVARGQAAFYDAAEAVRPFISMLSRVVSLISFLNDPVGFLSGNSTGIVSTIMSGISAVNTGIDLAMTQYHSYATQAAESHAVADAAWVRMNTHIQMSGAEIQDFSALMGATMDFLSGKVDGIYPKWGEMATQVQSSFDSVAGTFVTLIDNIDTTTAHIKDMERNAIQSAHNMSVAFRETMNLFNQTSPAYPGPDREDTTNPVPLYPNFDTGPRPIYGTGSLGTRGVSYSEYRYNYGSPDLPEASSASGSMEYTQPSSESYGGGGPSDAAYAYGGVVRGPGGNDRVRARLTSGEFVMPAGPAQRNQGLLNHIRAGGSPNSAPGRSNKTTRIEQHFHMNFPSVRRVDPDVMEREIMPTQKQVMRRQPRSKKP